MSTTRRGLQRERSCVLPETCSGCGKKITNARICNSCKEGVVYCDNCFKQVPQHKPNHRLHDGHVNVMYDFAKFVHESLTLDTTNQDIDIDYENNNFIALDFKDGKLKTGKKFEDVMANDQSYTRINEDEKLMSVVSFIGGSGSGKSAISRTICKKSLPKKELPCPGNPQNSRSTSSDIHAYQGIHKDEGLPTESQFLLFDCEGTGGTLFMHPEQRKNDKPVYVSELEKKKRKYVEESYPRIVYLYSDVVVFVFRGALKDYSAITKPLKMYAKKITAESPDRQVNFKPFLILVYNMVTQEDTVIRWKNHDPKWISKKFEKLENYYRKPQVVLIPKFGIDCILCARQIGILNDKIRECINEAYEIKKAQNLLIPKDQALNSMKQFISQISNDPTRTIDFTKIADLPKKVFNFFSMAYEEITRMESNRRALLIALQLTAEQIVFRYLKELKFEQKNIFHLNISNEVKDDLREVALLISESLKCAATQRLILRDGPIEISCEKTKRGHSDEHLSTAQHNPVLFSMRDAPRETPPDFNWPGEFEEMDGGDDVSIFKTLKEDVFAVRSNISNNMIYLHDLSKKDTCLLCLDKPPTESLGCKHRLCGECCLTMYQVNAGDFECPFCGIWAAWKPKEGDEEENNEQEREEEEEHVQTKNEGDKTKEEEKLQLEKHEKESEKEQSEKKVEERRVEEKEKERVVVVVTQEQKEVVKEKKEELNEQKKEELQVQVEHQKEEHSFQSVQTQEQKRDKITEEAKSSEEGSS